MTDTDGWRHLAMEANRRAVALMQERDDLRAKVEALPAWDPVSLGEDHIKRADVLALFDGEQQR